MTFVKVNNPIAKSLDGFVNDIFNEFPATFGKTFREDVFSFPPVNIVEKENGYEIKAAVPGFEKTDFNVKLDGNTLTISADKKEEKNETTEKTIRKEFSHKAFKRTFTLDDKIDTANINAKYENGLLTLDLPKKEETKTATKEINIQ